MARKRPSGLWEHITGDPAQSKRWGSLLGEKAPPKLGTPAGRWRGSGLFHTEEINVARAEMLAREVIVYINLEAVLWGWCPGEEAKVGRQPGKAYMCWQRSLDFIPGPRRSLLNWAATDWCLHFRGSLCLPLRVRGEQGCRDPGEHGTSLKEGWRYGPWSQWIPLNVCGSCSWNS